MSDDLRGVDLGTTVPASKHDPRGKDAKGHQPNARTEVKSALQRDYLVTLLGACPPERFQAIAETAVKQAEEGCRYARQWVSRYLMPEEFDAILRLLAQQKRGITSEDIVDHYKPPVVVQRRG